MTDISKGSTGGEPTVSSGTTNDDASTSGEAKKTYPADFVDKLKKEKENWKKEVEQLRSRLSSEEEKKLKENEEFKKLAELKAKEAEVLKVEKEALETKIRMGTINSAVKTELGKLGLDDNYSTEVFSLLSDQIKQAVTIDPDTQTVIGAEDLAKSFYQKYSSLGFFRKQGGQVNQSATKAGAIQHTKPDFSKMTTAQIVEYWKSQKGLN